MSAIAGGSDSCRRFSVARPFSYTSTIVQQTEIIPDLRGVLWIIFCQQNAALIIVHPFDPHDEVSAPWSER